MPNDKWDVFEDHTVDRGHSSEPVLPPGPPQPGDADFSPRRARRSPGFSTVPGAGANPSQPAADPDFRPDKERRSRGYATVPGAGANPTPPDQSEP
jgi:hypothetical protein